MIKCNFPKKELRKDFDSDNLSIEYFFGLVTLSELNFFVLLMYQMNFVRD